MERIQSRVSRVHRRAQKMRALAFFLLLLFFAAPTWSEGSFFRRGGGIDVGTHSKRNRTTYLFPILQRDNSSSTPLAPAAPGTTEETAAAERTEPRQRTRQPPPKQPEPAAAVLKVGVVLPKQIFQQRSYQKSISRSLQAVDREVMLTVRKHYRFQWKPSNFRLFDTKDSINYGNLVVSSPPYSECYCTHYFAGSSSFNLITRHHPPSV